MPELSDQAWAQVQEWLELPPRSRQRLLVTGERGTGKSAFLREIADRAPHAVFVDCRGLSMEEVALRVWAAAGADLDEDDLLRGRPALRGSLRGDHTVLLANAQWAGRTHTSSEPRLIVEALSLLLAWAPDAHIRMAVEWDGGRLSPPRRSDVLVAPPAPATPSAPGTPPGLVRPFAAAGAAGAPPHPLAVLAAAEVADVPEEVFRLLQGAMSGPSGEGAPALVEWSGLRTEFADALTVRHGAADEGEGLLLSFRAPALAQEWRDAYDVDASVQRRVVEVLMAGSARGPVGRYAHRALPAHAVLGGVLPDVLLRGEVLARLSPRAVWDALACAFPAGVPQDWPHGFLAEIGAIEARGAAALTQGEWAAWLQHAALSCGHPELAARIGESGVDLPWRTVWSRWRPGGVFGPLAAEVGRVDEIALVPHPDATGTYAVLTARDATTGKATDPDHAYVRQEWDPATGQRLSGPTVVPESLNEADWLYDGRLPEGVPAAFAERFDGEWEVEDDGDAEPGTPGAPGPLPRTPSFVTQGVAADGTWVLAGEGGLFAVAGVVAEPSSVGEPAWRAEPLVAPHTRAAAPDLPPDAAAFARGEADGPAWLEESFGRGACRRRPEDEIPDGVPDPGARRFLSAVGLPDVEGFAHLRTTGGLSPAIRTEAAGPVGGGVAWYSLGSWMHAELLLNGTTGEVFRGAPGTGPELVGGSLPRFFTMVRLFDTFRRAFHPSRADRRAALAVLSSWCAHIDPVAADGETWEAVLGGTEFEDGTWDLVSRDGRPPL